MNASEQSGDKPRQQFEKIVKGLTLEQMKALVVQAVRKKERKRKRFPQPP